SGGRDDRDRRQPDRRNHRRLISVEDVVGKVASLRMSRAGLLRGLPLSYPGRSCGTGLCSHSAWLRAAAAEHTLAILPWTALAPRLVPESRLDKAPGAALTGGATGPCGVAVRLPRSLGRLRP